MEMAWAMLGSLVMSAVYTNKFTLDWAFKAFFVVHIRRILMKRCHFDPG